MRSHTVNPMSSQKTYAELPLTNSDAGGRRPGRTLAAAQLASSLGDGVFLVTSALYFTRVVGLTAGQVGAALTIGWAVGLLAGVPLGSVADRRGSRGTAVVLAATTALAVASLLVARSFPAFLAGVCVYTASQTGLAAARQALLAALVPPRSGPGRGPGCSPPRTPGSPSARPSAVPRCTSTPRRPTWPRSRSTPSASSSPRCSCAGCPSYGRS